MSNLFAPAKPAPAPPQALPPANLFAPAKPQLPAPTTGPPAPALAKVGYWGSMQDFNMIVQRLHDQHLLVNGVPPSPDRMLTEAVAAGTPAADPLAAAKQSNDYNVVRHDGYTEPNNSLRRMLYGGSQPGLFVQQPPQQPTPGSPATELAASDVPRTGPISPATTPAPTLAKFQALQAKHPWVPAGGLPLPQDQMRELLSALGTQAQTPGLTKQLLVGGETIAEYERQNVLANPALGTYGAEIQATRAAHSVTTVQQAQQQLKQLAPGFFGTLDATGTINSDWSSAITKYQTTPLFFRQQTVQLAKDNHFGNDTGAFIHAWQMKQAALTKYPEFHQLLMATPLSVFSANHFSLGALKNQIFGAKGWGWIDLPTVGLHTLTASAGLAFGELGGAINTAEADAAAFSAYLNATTPKGSGIPGLPSWLMGSGPGLTEHQARARALKIMTEDHPQVIQIVDPNYKGGAVGDIAQVAFDVWLGSVRFTGEKLAAGDVGGALDSRYFNNRTGFSHASVQQGDIAGAVKSLEGGLGAEKLVTALEPGIKDGTVSPAQFRQHAAELLQQGHTTVGEQTITGPLFSSLLSRDLPTANRAGQAIQQTRERISRAADAFENSIRTNTQLGATNHAADFVASVRRMFPIASGEARAAPAGGVRDFYNDTRMPDDIYNWARTNLKDQQLAESLREQAIRLRAAENTPGLVALGDQMRELFLKAHPDVEMKPSPLDSGGAQLESELRSRLYFPKALDTKAAQINDTLNQAGRIHREIIISGAPIPGGESLAWKHAIDDTGRRIIGGGGFWNKGVTPDLTATKTAVDAHLTANPEDIRALGATRSAAVMGENRWINGYAGTDNETFRTGDALSETDPTLRFDHKPSMDAAGAYLRNTLASNALRAFQRSTPQDLTPLTALVMQSSKYRALAFSDPAYLEQVKGLTGDALDTARQAQAHAYAELLYKRYSEIDTAGKTAGVADPLNEGLGVLIKNLGPHSDEALGQWLKDNQINMPVRDGLVSQSRWDDVMQKWIGVLMTANKWNRGVLFDHVLYSTIKSLTGVGWKMDEAIPVAAELAQRQTVYHMLDFANMLQVEQNYRWLAYFATKHRLYWSWILAMAKQRPGLAAAAGDVRQHLDAKGNLNVNVGGYDVAVPLARLLWLNSSGYPATSPLVQAGVEAGKGLAEGKGAQAFPDALSSLTATSGNLFTRQDQWLGMLAKFALVSGGVMPASSDAVTAGMGATQKLYFQEAVNRYSAFYRQEHGKWPSEADAVKYALLHGTAQEAWRANLPLPLVVNDATTTPPAVKAEMDAYNRITDPAKKRAFLDNHPDVALRFGVAQDPMVFLHNNVLWDQFNHAKAHLTAAQDALYQQMLKSGYTLDVNKQMKALSTWWRQQIQQLEIQDAATWHGNAQFPKGVVNEGQVMQQGPWTTQLSGDPLAAQAFIHQAFPSIGPKELTAHTVGGEIVELRKTLALFRQAYDTQNPGMIGPKYTLQQVHDAISAMSQRLSVFAGYPKDAAQQAQSAYYSKFFTPYAAERDKRQAAVNAQPTNTALHSEFRAWKDSHDHAVVVDYGGHKIKFPSVVQIGWANLPDGVRHQALAQAASGNWAHIASYEKTMLGVPVKADVSEGWAKYADAVAAYEKVPGNPNLVAAQKTGLAREIDKVYPGFYKDYLFAAQPKVDRFERTTLYRQIPERQWFDENIGGPAKQIGRAIAANGNRTYYERAWRNYVTDQLTPFLDRHPALKAELANYGPNFLDTLVSTS